MTSDKYAGDTQRKAAATTDEPDAAEQLRRVQAEMAQLTQAVTALERMTPEARELALGYLNRRYGRAKG